MIECIRTSITVQTRFECIHCWPEAPEEEYYLRQPHRHVMFVIACIEVKHNDRELEFIHVKHSLDCYLQTTHFGLCVSCEDIAHRVAKYLHSQYGDRNISVCVKEDNENGAIVDYVREELLNEED